MGLLSQKYSPGPALCWFGIRAEGTELKRRVRKRPRPGVMIHKGWAYAHHQAKGGGCATQGRATRRRRGQNVRSMMVCFVFQCIPWITVGYLLNEEVDGWRNEFRSLAWLEVCIRDHPAWRDRDRPDCDGPKYPAKAPALSPGLPGKWQQQGEVTSKCNSCFYLWVYWRQLTEVSFSTTLTSGNILIMGRLLWSWQNADWPSEASSAVPRRGHGGPGTNHSTYPPTLSLSSGQGVLQESSQVTTSTLPRV